MSKSSTKLPKARASCGLAIRSGTFWINGYRAIHVGSPFGGYKHSGYGRTSGIEALYEYTQTKSVWVQTAASSVTAIGRA